MTMILLSQADLQTMAEIGLNAKYATRLMLERTAAIAKIADNRDVLSRHMVQAHGAAPASVGRPRKTIW